MAVVNVQKDDFDRPDATDPPPAYPGYRRGRDEPRPLRPIPWQAWIGGIVTLALLALFIVYKINSLINRWSEMHPREMDTLGWVLWIATTTLFIGGTIWLLAYARAILLERLAQAGRARIVRDPLDNLVDVRQVLVGSSRETWLQQFAARQHAEIVMAPERKLINVKTYSGGTTETASTQIYGAGNEPTATLIDPSAGPLLTQLRKRYGRSAEHLFVGSVGDTPMYLRWGTAGVSAIIGGSGGGKTNTARLIAAWHALNGGGLALCDGHGEVRDESLIDSCQPLREAFVLPSAISDNDIYAVIRRMDAIGRARINGQEPKDIPLLLVIDEFISLCRNHPKAAEIVNMLVNFGDEYRKVNMQVILALHHGRGDVIDDKLGTVVRATIGTRIVHNTDPKEAKYWLKANEVQGVDRLRPGEALFFDRTQDVQKIVVPWLPAEALREVSYPVHPGWPLSVETPKDQQRSPRQKLLDDVRRKMENAPRAERLRVADELALRGAKQREIQYACVISDEAAGAAWRLYHGG